MPKIALLLAKWARNLLFPFQYLFIYLFIYSCRYVSLCISISYLYWSEFVSLKHLMIRLQ